MSTMKRALKLVKRRRYCAHWLIHKSTLKALLRRRLVVPCGFYSVCLPERFRLTGGTKVTLSNGVRYLSPGRLK